MHQLSRIRHSRGEKNFNFTWTKKGQIYTNFMILRYRSFNLYSKRDVMRQWTFEDKKPPTLSAWRSSPICRPDKNMKRDHNNSHILQNRASQTLKKKKKIFAHITWYTHNIVVSTLGYAIHINDIIKYARKKKLTYLSIGSAYLKSTASVSYDMIHILRYTICFHKFTQYIKDCYNIQTIVITSLFVRC